MLTLLHLSLYTKILFSHKNVSKVKRNNADKFFEETIVYVDRGAKLQRKTGIYMVIIWLG